MSDEKIGSEMLGTIIESILEGDGFDLGNVPIPMPAGFDCKCFGWSFPGGPDPQPEPRFLLVCKECPNGPYFPTDVDTELLKMHARQHQHVLERWRCWQREAARRRIKRQLRRSIMILRALEQYTLASGAISFFVHEALEEAIRRLDRTLSNYDSRRPR